MVSSYFVYGGGVWRELDTSTGAVRGWRRRARFVYVRRGRLQLARRRPVLRALQALARGEPSAAADGPRLAHLRKDESRVALESVRSRAPASSASAPMLHCCAHYNGCSGETSVSTARESVEQPGPGEAVRAPPRPPRPAARPGPRCSKPRAVQLHADSIELLSSSKPDSEMKKRPVDSEQDSSSSPRSKRPRISSGTTETGDTAEEECRELVIPEQDLAALRGFVARKHSSALERFDGDEQYRRALCYAVNPLVSVTRCRKLERMHRQQAASRAKPDIERVKREEPQASTSREARAKPRATYSELRRPQRSEVAEKMKQTTPAKQESKTKPPATKLTSPRKELPTKPVPATKGSASKHELIPPPVVLAHTAISKRPSAWRSKEYSSLEDHCIVSWVVCGERASQVNGNRLWQELQQQYPSLTGQERSWHSLRNRYLRYILPSLGALGLPPADVSRLRAAAATGVMRAPYREAVRRASILQQEDVRSASARRPRPPPAADKPTQTNDDDEPPPGRAPRRAPSAPAASPPLRNSPRLAAAASLHNGAASVDSDGSDDAPLSQHSKKAAVSRAARRSRSALSASSASEPGTASEHEQSAPRRSLRYSDVTRQFAARKRPAASDTSVTSDAARPTRTTRTSRAHDTSDSADDFAPQRPLRSRKLYNANARL
ncbi:unnamed protein product [Chrysodeixis includens]|uniref:TERF2-interacting telomeric protein 1 Myb domain-containing protein n=1 Tax=Chrysodeixis includens TaxID=689277 RepID=A0A9P0BYA1_CHRIL|nr:unnamed protein product [Chrysodeixis includens]